VAGTKLKTKPTNLKEDPWEVFQVLASAHENCFLLESLADQGQPQTAGQSYIGVAPERHFAAQDGQFYTDGQAIESAKPYDELRKHIAFDAELPDGYAGGLVGYSSHEAFAGLEPTLEFPYERQFFDFEYGLYKDGLIFKEGKPPEYFYYDEDRSDLYKGDAVKPPDLAINFLGERNSFSDYSSMLEKALDDIRNGRVFQVILANQYEYRFEGDLLQLYKEIRRINPSPYMFFIKFGDVVTLGASPELLVHTTRDKTMHVEALAGTIRRGRTDGEDKALAAALLGDDKEIAEHNMLVDLARNDVGRVSQIGSVKIDRLMYIKRLSHVQHICSTISGKLASEFDAFDALAASFPAGTLVGTPKIEATEMIKELEGYERGPYGGIVGYISYSGNSMHAVNIRSVSAVGGKLVMHSGSGIVYDSVADREFEEISEKKAAMDRAMAPFLEETVT
jgi:anthranilate synthase component 1